MDRSDAAVGLEMRALCGAFIGFMVGVLLF
jgi:hypothetical protein